MRRLFAVSAINMFCLLAMVMLLAGSPLYVKTAQAAVPLATPPPTSCGIPGSQAGCSIFRVHYAFYTPWGQQVAIPGIWCIDCGNPGSGIDSGNNVSSYDDLLASDTEGAQGARGNLTVEDPGADPYSAQEIKAANYVADHVFNSPADNLTLRPARGQRLPDGTTSDLVINGKTYDILSPSTSDTNSIFRSVYNKNSQATGIILDLTDSTATSNQFSNLIGRLVGKSAQDGVPLNITDVYIIDDVSNAQYTHLQYTPTGNP